MKYSAAQEQELMSQLWSPEIADDPEAFVMFAYPWKEKGTPLERFDGPRNWQREELQEIADHIKSQKERMAKGLNPEMWKKATSSGRGPGKSALVSWLSNWMMSTVIGSTTIVTANTETQLRTRTFAEIGKWSTMLINSHWFEPLVLSLSPKEWFKVLLKEQLKVDTAYYYCQGQTWSEENPDAFAGAHNQNGLMLLMDESSGIPKPIWTVAEGFFTEPVLHRYWLPYSNPRRNSGAFFDCFHEDKKFWRLRSIDSRTVEGTDKAIYDEIIAKHGEDSDIARIEVLGQFPKQGDKQFIPNNIVYAAQKREVAPDPHAALILGIDIARFGNASTVARFRQGRDARSIPPRRWKNRDNVYLAIEIARLIDLTKPDAVNIDAGNGTGVIDILRSMGYRINEIWFGGKSNSREWANKRTEMFAEVRAWLPGAAIDDDPILFRDLTAAEYFFYGKSKDAVMLESKESMQQRGIPSPDDGDALALTHAKKVARRDLHASRHYAKNRIAKDVDYPIFG